MASCTMAAAAIASPLSAPASRELSSSVACGVSTKASMFVKRVAARTVCSAEQPQRFAETSKKAAAALALAAVLGVSQPALADVAGLTPCKESKAFAKREKQEIKKLEGRLKNYEADSAPALAIKATVEKTKRRFATYGNEGLLCGSDGLPHLIVDGDQKHLGEFVFPGIVFLYITGWIGWVGREYLIAVRSMKKPTEKEIIIDVPLALKIMSTGFTWPLSAVNALRNGSLIESDANITVSPR